MKYRVDCIISILRVAIKHAVASLRLITIASGQKGQNLPGRGALARAQPAIGEEVRTLENANTK